MNSWLITPFLAVDIELKSNIFTTYPHKKQKKHQKKKTSHEAYTAKIGQSSEISFKFSR